MTSLRQFLLATLLLCSGSTSPILSGLQEAYLDHWNGELYGDNKVGSSFSKWQQAYLDHWNMELSPELVHPESRQFSIPTEQNENLSEDEMMEGNMKDSRNEKDVIKEIFEDSTDSPVQYGQ